MYSVFSIMFSEHIGPLMLREAISPFAPGDRSCWLAAASVAVDWNLKHDSQTPTTRSGDWTPFAHLIARLIESFIFSFIDLQFSSLLVREQSFSFHCLDQSAAGSESIISACTIWDSYKLASWIFHRTICALCALFFQPNFPGQLAWY